MKSSLVFLVIVLSVSGADWNSSVEMLLKGSIKPSSFVDSWKGKVEPSKIIDSLLECFEKRHSERAIIEAGKFAISLKSEKLFQRVISAGTGERFRSAVHILSKEVAESDNLRNSLFWFGTNSSDSLVKSFVSDVIMEVRDCRAVAGMLEWALRNFPPVAAGILRRSLADEKCVKKASEIMKKMWFEVNISSVSPDFPYLVAELFLKAKSPMIEWVLSAFPDDDRIKILTAKYMLKTGKVDRCLSVLKGIEEKRADAAFLSAVANFLSGNVVRAEKLLKIARRGQIAEARRLAFLIKLYSAKNPYDVVRGANLYPRDLFVSYVILKCGSGEVKSDLVKSEVWLMAGEVAMFKKGFERIEKVIKDRECLNVVKFLKRTNFVFIGERVKGRKFDGKSFWKRYEVFLNALGGDTNSVFELASKEDLWWFLFTKR